MDPIPSDPPPPESAPEEARPFAAPCVRLPAGAAWHWLRLGWNDLRRAPGQSLCYGLAMLMLSYLITGLAWRLGDAGLYLGLLSGFVFIGPCLALQLYTVSMRLERGQSTSFGASLSDIRRRLGDTMVFALVLTVVFLLWARAATVLHIFFPEHGRYQLRDLALFLGIGSLVGALFCSIVFAASAFSLPMLMDRKVDAVTAVVSSANAVLRNKPAMMLWASIIVACVLIGVLTAYLAFLVLLPLLGHATWHAYRQTLDPSAWPASGSG
ncbi:Uncharacterized membrane protein [Solimonas aquatica]|uniref:Uncharacterized membrane protein n=1 Tax=Solimonas aquatica TaxID=489703 RepID=A0A1H9MCN6_9GAMM|nr:DUF2189 domain-containing protein [Solimonas aquatica]SER21392.1 Uncharacterized membrane protein [Solimonas aquatica]